MKIDINRLREYLSSPGLWLFAFAAEAAAIFILSVIPAIGGGMNSGLAAHLLAYTTFSCTAGILLITKKVSLAIVKGALFAALYGGCIELVQTFIPYRSGRLADEAVNCLAALSGMAAAGIVQVVFFRKTPAPEKDGR